MVLHSMYPLFCGTPDMQETMSGRDSPVPSCNFLQRGLGAGSTQREAYWWCPGGVLEALSGLEGTIYTKSNLGSGNPCFEKLADFPYMHVEMGGICPMWPSTPLATKRAPIGKKPRRLAVSSSRDQELRTRFQGLQWFFSQFARWWLHFVAGILVRGPTRTRGLNAACVSWLTGT